MLLYLTNNTILSKIDVSNHKEKIMLELKNIMEETIMTRINEVMPNMDCCSCEQCKIEAATYALNRLPAKYVSTATGALISKLDATDIQKDANITSIVVQAIQVIKEHPHCNCQRNKNN